MKHQQHTHQHKSTSPKRIFNTPLRECAHADKGCCPKCMDPMKTAVSKENNMTFRLGRNLFRA